MSSDWKKRDYDPADEAGVVFLWLKSFAKTAYGRLLKGDLACWRLGHTRLPIVDVLLAMRSRDGRPVVDPDEVAFFELQAPKVEWLLKHAKVEILCDPERPEVIWAFACTSGDTVHYVCVKHEAVTAGFAAEMLRDLLGDRLERSCVFTYPLDDLWRGKYGDKPQAHWKLDARHLAEKMGRAA